MKPSRWESAGARSRRADATVLFGTRPTNLKGRRVRSPDQASAIARSARRRGIRNDRPLDQVLLPLGVREGARPDLEIFLQAQGDDQLSVREEPAQPALPRRARLAPLSQRRGALYRL